MHFGNDERQKLFKGTKAKRHFQNDTRQKISKWQIPKKVSLQQMPKKVLFAKNVQKYFHKARNVSTPSPQRGGASTCLNNRKKSDKNIFTTFTFRFQQYDHKLTNFSIKSYLENVRKFWFWSTNQNKLTKIAFFVFLPILMSCQFSFFGKKKCQSTLFWRKICQNHLVVGRRNPSFCQK